MSAQILAIVAPVFALAAIGFVWAKLDAPFDIAFVTRLAMNVSGPCLIFSTLATVDIDRDLFEALALATATLYVVIAFAIAALIWVGRLSTQTYWSPMVFGNTGNIGLPIALFAYGPDGLALAIVIFAVMATLNFTIGVWVVSGDPSPRTAATQPIFIGSLLGVIWSYFDLSAPPVVLETLSLVGQIMIPTMLITLGVSIARLSMGAFGRALGLSALKILIGLLAGLWTAEAFGLDGMARDVLLIQAVMPVAVTSYLLAARYDAGPDDVAGLVVASTSLSVLALPALLAAVLTGA